MSIAVEKLLNSFDTLSDVDKHEAAVQILKRSPDVEFKPGRAEQFRAPRRR